MSDREGLPPSDTEIILYQTEDRKSCIQFRRWATELLREYIVKGFVLDDQRPNGEQAFGADYFDELLERIRDIRASEKRFYQKVRDIYTLSIDCTAARYSMEEAKQTLKKSLYARKIAFITYILAAMLVVIATVNGVAYFWQYFHEPTFPGYFTLIMIYLYESIWWYMAAALCVNLGKVMDMYMEGIRDARTISYPLLHPGYRPGHLVDQQLYPWPAMPIWSLALAW